MSYSQSEADLLKQLADAQARVEALQAQYSELLEALDCVLAERPLPSGEYVHRVSCNGDRRKPAGTVGISCSCRVGQQRVEALQRERDLYKHSSDTFAECVDNIREAMGLETTHYLVLPDDVGDMRKERDQLKLALDAEREKVKALDAMYRQQLEGRDKRIENLAGSAKIWMEKLAQLQALVRAWGTAHESVDDWFRRAATDENTPTISEFEAVKKVLFDSERALKATLDATTPAPIDAAETHDRMFNHTDRHPEAL